MPTGYLNAAQRSKAINAFKRLHYTAAEKTAVLHWVAALPKARNLAEPWDIPATEPTATDITVYAHEMTDKRSRELTSEGEKITVDLALRIWGAELTGHGIPITSSESDVLTKSTLTFEGAEYYIVRPEPAMVFGADNLALKLYCNRKE